MQASQVSLFIYFLLFFLLLSPSNASDTYIQKTYFIIHLLL